MGLQCSLCPTAEPVASEFPAVNRAQLEEILKRLDDGIVLAVSFLFASNIGNFTLCPTIFSVSCRATVK